jgi:hypothetical protein
MEASIQGEYLQPRETDLKKLAKKILQTPDWRNIFPGVASINLTREGSGPSLSLRLTKMAGIPVQLVPEGPPGATVVAVKRVDELGFYNLGRDALAEKVGVTGPKTTAVIRYLKLNEDTDCFKEFLIGNTRFGRYSQNAIGRISSTLTEHPIEEIWKTHGIRSRRSKTAIA